MQGVKICAIGVNDIDGNPLTSKKFVDVPLFVEITIGEDKRHITGILSLTHDHFTDEQYITMLTAYFKVMVENMLKDINTANIG